MINWVMVKLLLVLDTEHSGLISDNILLLFTLSLALTRHSDFLP